MENNSNFLKHCFFITLLFLTIGCTQNIFDEIANKDTDEAKYFEARQKINSRSYGEAIEILETIEPSYLQVRERVPVYASAYSGRCGLEFLTLLNSIQNSSVQTIFLLLMSAFPGAQAANVQDCLQAEGIIEAVGDETARNGDENLLIAFNSLAKIGTILSSLADTDDDGAADGTFDQCDNTDFPDTMVRELGSSIGTTIASLGAIGTSYIDGATQEVEALCDEHPNLEIFCSPTDPADFDPAEVEALRIAIGSSDLGINSCGGNDFGDCALANVGSCP